MADVRSLLRSELASRKGSPQTGPSTPNRVTKKRKVDPADAITRKKIRHTDPDVLASPSVQVRPSNTQAVGEDDAEPVPPQDLMKTEPDETVPVGPQDITKGDEEGRTTQHTEVPSILITPTTQSVDEDEWAAFEREVVAPTRVPQRPAALAAAATISAAPISTEELAALREKEGNESQRRNREAEVEGEREDAARFLEEEFDEMEQLEERVRRLKSMREQLRSKRVSEGGKGDEAVALDKGSAPAGESASPDIKRDEEEADEDENDDDEADDDWDNWRFR